MNWLLHIVNIIIGFIDLIIGFRFS